MRVGRGAPLLLDVTALESGAQCLLFVDDGRFRSSCAAAVALTSEGLTEYASNDGVIYPTASNEKCVVVTDNVHASTTEQPHSSIEGRLQGGTARIAATAEHLGSPIGQNKKVAAEQSLTPKDDADLILREMESSGSSSDRCGAINSGCVATYCTPLLFRTGAVSGSVFAPRNNYEQKQKM